MEAEQVVNKIENLEKIQSYFLRFWYFILSAPFFTWVYKGDYNKWSDVRFSELSITTITFVIVCLGILIIIPIFLWWLIESKQTQIHPLFNQYHIQPPQRYIPMLVFWFYLISLVAQVAFEWASWIVWIITIVVFEWYFRTKKKANDQLLSQLKNRT